MLKVLKYSIAAFYFALTISCSTPHSAIKNDTYLTYKERSSLLNEESDVDVRDDNFVKPTNRDEDYCYTCAVRRYSSNVWYTGDPCFDYFAPCSFYPRLYNRSGLFFCTNTYAYYSYWFYNPYIDNAPNRHNYPSRSLSKIHNIVYLPSNNGFYYSPNPTPRQVYSLEPSQSRPSNGGVTNISGARRTNNGNTRPK